MSIFDYLAMTRSAQTYPPRPPDTERLILHLTGGTVVHFDVPTGNGLVSSEELREAMAVPETILNLTSTSGDQWTLRASAIALAIRQPALPKPEEPTP